MNAVGYSLIAEAEDEDPGLFAEPRKGRQAQVTQLGTDTSIASVLDQRFSAHQLNAIKADAARIKCFLADLRKAVQELLLPHALALSGRLVSELNAVGYSLVAEPEDDAPGFRYSDLCFRYSDLGINDHRGNTLVVFDITVSVQLVGDTTDAGGARDDLLAAPPSPTIEIGRFSRSMIEALSSELTRIEAKEKELQVVLERHMCEELRGSLRTIVARLNALGYSLNELVDTSAEPEVDFRDDKNGLLVGIYCVSTVDFRYRWGESQ